MSPTILVSLIPTIAFLFSASLLLYLYREKFRCLCTASYTALSSDEDTESAPSTPTPNPDSTSAGEQNAHRSWTDALVDRAVRQVWTGFDLDVLFDQPSPIPARTAVHGDPDDTNGRCGNASRLDIRGNPHEGSQ